MFRESYFCFRDQLSKSEKKQLHREKLRLANPAGVTKKSAAEMNSAENDGKGIKKTFPNYLIAMQITNPEVSRVNIRGPSYFRNVHENFFNFFLLYILFCHSSYKFQN